MKLGQKVRYVRQRSDLKIEEGQGTLVSITFNETKRPIFQLDIGGELITVHKKCMNPTEATVIAFCQHQDKINGMVKEHNEKSQKAMAIINAKIDKANNKFFGKPIDVDAMPKPVKEEAEEV